MYGAHEFKSYHAAFICSTFGPPSLITLQLQAQRRGSRSMATLASSRFSAPAMRSAACLACDGPNEPSAAQGILVGALVNPGG